jgi:hypothetical protein
MESKIFGGQSVSAETPMFSTSPDGENVVVVPLSVSQWRICDTRWPEGDSRQLLGFIETTKDGDFEVMSLVHGFEWYTYASLADAIAHFAYVRRTGDNAGPLDVGSGDETLSR